MGMSNVIERREPLVLNPVDVLALSAIRDVTISFRVPIEVSDQLNEIVFMLNERGYEITKTDVMETMIRVAFDNVSEHSSVYPASESTRT